MRRIETKKGKERKREHRRIGAERARSCPVEGCFDFASGNRALICIAKYTPLVWPCGRALGRARARIPRSFPPLAVPHHHKPLHHTHRHRHTKIFIRTCHHPRTAKILKITFFFLSFTFFAKFYRFTFPCCEDSEQLANWRRFMGRRKFLNSEDPLRFRSCRGSRIHRVPLQTDGRKISILFEAKIILNESKILFPREGRSEARNTKRQSIVSNFFITKYVWLFCRNRKCAQCFG